MVGLTKVRLSLRSICNRAPEVVVSSARYLRGVRRQRLLRALSDREHDRKRRALSVLALESDRSALCLN